jgi:hypothetical protein
LPSASATPAIRSVRYLGRAPAQAGNGWFLAGQDGGQSIPIQGKTLWLFSDTLLGTRTDSNRNELLSRPLTRRTSRFLGNCAALSEAASFEVAMRDLHYYEDTVGRPREILCATEQERLAGYRFWPEHGVLLGGKVYLFYIGIYQFDPSSTWGFRGVGSGLAVMDPVAGRSERLSNQNGWCLWPILGDDLHFGVQLLREEGFVYVFSSRRMGMFSYALLARVLASDITNPAAYEYLSSQEPAWSDDPSDSCELTLCSPEFSVSFNPYLEKYLMVYVDGYAKQLVFRTASALWGLYSEPNNVGRLPHAGNSALLSLGFEHSQFAINGGQTIFISYCQPCFTQNGLVALTFG